MCSPDHADRHCRASGVKGLDPSGNSKSEIHVKLKQEHSLVVYIWKTEISVSEIPCNVEGRRHIDKSPKKASIH